MEPPIVTNSKKKKTKACAIYDMISFSDVAEYCESIVSIYSWARGAIIWNENIALRRLIDSIANKYIVMRINHIH